MPDGYRVDPATLENVTSSLRKAGTTLDSIDTGPGAPDGGELSGAMAALLGRFTADASEVVTGVSAAGDQLANAREVYLGQERATSRNLPSF
jgi:hypothetical protein